MFSVSFRIFTESPARPNKEDEVELPRSPLFWVQQVVLVPFRLWGLLFLVILSASMFFIWQYPAHFGGDSGWLSDGYRKDLAR